MGTDDERGARVNTMILACAAKESALIGVRGGTKLDLSSNAAGNFGIEILGSRLKSLDRDGLKVNKENLFPLNLRYSVRHFSGINAFKKSLHMVTEPSLVSDTFAQRKGVLDKRKFSEGIN